MLDYWLIECVFARPVACLCSSLLSKCVLVCLLCWLLVGGCLSGDRLLACLLVRLFVCMSFVCVASFRSVFLCLCVCFCVVSLVASLLVCVLVRSYVCPFGRSFPRGVCLIV